MLSFRGSVSSVNFPEPDVELTTVCTTRPESAAEARHAFGATLAFHIDAVAVVVRVPAHDEPTRAAIDALRFVAGPFARVACLVTTQARHWYETDTPGGTARWSPRGPSRRSAARGSGCTAHGAATRYASWRSPSASSMSRPTFPRRSVQRRADVCPVRRGDPDRAQPPANVRHGGGPAPLRRDDPAGVGDGPGAAGRLTCAGARGHPAVP